MASKRIRDGVNAASDGSGKLVVGMGQITANSDALNQGEDAIFNAILGMVNEQLQAQFSTSGFTFLGLTTDGYGKELDQMAATFTQRGAPQVQHSCPP